MVILHKLEDFLFELFPKAKADGKNNGTLIEELKEFYTYGPYNPRVSINDGWIKIEIDTPSIISQEAEYKKVIACCEKGNLAEAKKLLEPLIQKNPTNSEYHRVYGQILSDQGNEEEAINSLIDALRWNPKNAWALLMMGNIYARHKDDVDTAMKYYDQAAKINPNDNIAINNIGGALMQIGKIAEAKKYFWEAIKIKDNYPNTHYALALIAEMEDDLDSSLYSAIQAIKMNEKKDGLYNNSLRHAIDTAAKIIKTGIGQKIFNDYKNKLEYEGEKIIEVVKDESLPTAAKIEFAEVHNRDAHRIKYKPSYPAVEHLLMHELVHLEFVIEARKAGANELFVSTQQQKSIFIKNIETDIKRLRKLGFTEDSIAKLSGDLFDGINRQIFNTPIDLFIENYLYNEFPELRAYQFYSLYNMVKEGLNAVTQKEIVELMPKTVLSHSKIFNLVYALQFKDLYGISLVNDFKPTGLELNQATKFYEEYLEYKDDREPGEEYELVAHWAEDMKLDKYFELVGEDSFYKNRTNLEGLLESIENDPYDVQTKDPVKEREMKTFQEKAKSIGTNMAVVMFMVDALQYFEKMPVGKVKEIAFEIARLGTQGIRPDAKDYQLHLVPGKKFSGYHLLAYYYVSWKIAVPEMLSKLQLPYDNEYEMADSMHKLGKHG
ncbi:MAG: tetratricopeptide repeat protein [Bacteroidetes bacterium]|nr:tetratricopeptide repeat protein [Bacteroidota bacterium]